MYSQNKNLLNCSKTSYYLGSIQASNDMRVLLLLILQFRFSISTLIPPFDHGVIVKISEGVLQTIAQEVVDKAVEDLKTLSLSDSIKDGQLTINYWDLTFPKLTMNPTVNVTKEEEKGKLILDGNVRGDISATSRWRVIKKTFVGSLSFTGGVVIKMSGFSVTTRVILGEISDNGHLGFQHDPNFCEFHAGDLDLHFSGRTGWIINLFINVFKPKMRELMQQYVCLVINNEVGKAANDLNTSVFDRYDKFKVKGHTIEINNVPWIITGGDTCAVIGALGQITMPHPANNTEVTDPFIDPTEAPNTAFLTTSTPHSSTYSSSSSTSGDRRIRRGKRDVVDWCAVLPGAGAEVAVIVTEEIISRMAVNLHHLNLVHYKAEQARGTTEMFEQYWGGEHVGRVKISTKNNAMLRDYRVTFKITSVAPPNVTITELGIFVSSHLQGRVVLEKGGLEVRMEFHTIVTFLGRCNLVHSQGMYRLVPALTSGADVTSGRIQVTGLITGIALDVSIVQEIEDQLNGILGNSLPQLIKRELKDGFPLNIPENLQIVQARIEYRKKYILISADNVEISL